MTIVNFATKEYKAGQRRLIASLHKHQYWMFNHYESIDSPTHQESPYEFKIHTIIKGFEMDDIVLWVDSSMWLVGDLSKIEKIIKRDGYFMSEAGHWVGSWTNQHTRDYFKLTDEESKVPGGFKMFSAGLLGLDKNSQIALEFLKQWRASAYGGCFRGDYANHRHDQTCGSIIAERLKMRYQRGGEHMSYIGPGYSAPESGTVFYLQGL